MRLSYPPTATVRYKISGTRPCFTTCPRGAFRPNLVLGKLVHRAPISISQTSFFHNKNLSPFLVTYPLHYITTSYNTSRITSLSLIHFHTISYSHTIIHHTYTVVPVHTHSSQRHALISHNMADSFFLFPDSLSHDRSSFPFLLLCFFAKSVRRFSSRDSAVSSFM